MNKKNMAFNFKNIELKHRDRILEILPLIHIQPKCLRYYHEAFTHRSFKAENEWPYQDNERLEFVGDSILQSNVSLFLVNQYFHATQGELTILRALLVRSETLTTITMKYRLYNAFLVSKGEKSISEHFCKQYLKQSPYDSRYEPFCGLFEALVAAYYYDCGPSIVSKWLRGIFLETIQALSKEKYVKDSKTRLQEITRKIYGEEPYYQTHLSEENPKSGFFTKVFVKKQYLGCGYGRTKKESQKSAAQNILQKQKWTT
jgi:ribonuclease-3